MEERRKYPNSGVMFNAEKRKENSPDFTGRAEVTCPHCQQEGQWEVSSWIKQGNRGKFFSLSFRQPKAQREGGKAAEAFPWEE